MANPKGNIKASIKPGGNQKAFVPVTLPNGLDQQIQQPYIQKGLTYKSNNKFVMNRDDAGNIILDPGSNSQPVPTQNLIVEPSIERILNKSVIDVSKTQFTYFKFPAKSKSDGSNLGFDNLNIDVGAADAIASEYNARYVMPLEKGAYGGVVNWEKMSCGVRSTPNNQNGNAEPICWFDTNWAYNWQKDWYTSGQAEIGGWQMLFFEKAIEGNSQLDPGTILITPEMIDSLKEVNKTLKFEIVLQCYITSAGTNSNVADKLSDSIVYYDQQTKYGMFLSRSMPTSYRSNTQISRDGKQMVYDAQCPPNIIEQLQTNGSAGSRYKQLSLTYVLDINEAVEYDKYKVFACGQHPSYYMRETSYFNVRVIDDPGSGNYGVQ